MVHVSNLSKRPVSSAKDVVQRGQQVWVKVLSTVSSDAAPGPGGKPQRVTLSMRDVDQV